MAKKRRGAGRPRTKPQADPEGVKAKLAARLRELRERAGLTQSEMAKRCGVSHVFYGTVERGEKAPTIDTLSRLARGCGVTEAELLAFEAPKRRSAMSSAEKLGHRVALIAERASEAKLARFEKIARLFFESDE